jgi:integrase
LVFPGADGTNPANIREAWNTALKAARIEDFKFHDLRHSAASYLLMNGASIGEIADVLGHKTLAMVKRYSHVADNHRAAVVEKMNRAVFGGGQGRAG